MSFVDYVSVGGSGAYSPHQSGTSRTDLERIDVDVFMTSTGNTNWSTLQTVANLIHNAYSGSSGAQNAERYWDLTLVAGTYDIEIMHMKDSNRGIYSVQVDGVEVGTVDGYAAAQAYNVLSSVTGVAIAAGQRRVKLKMATKNASSSGYAGAVQHVQLRRTGA